MIKQIFLSAFALLFISSSIASAGIDGTYRIRGTERAYGGKYPFTGSLVVSGHKRGVFTLHFEDGAVVKMYFYFDPRLKDGLKTQTVESSTPPGNGTVTFRRINGAYRITFNYKAKHTDVKGSGKGRKTDKAARGQVMGRFARQSQLHPTGNGTSGVTGWFVSA